MIRGTTEMTGSDGILRFFGLRLYGLRLEALQLRDRDQHDHRSLSEIIEGAKDAWAKSTKNAQN